MHRTVQFTAVSMTGLLAGNELGTALWVHPAVKDLPLRAQIEAEQTISGRLGRVMPFYMTGALTSAIAAAVDRRGERGFGPAAAAAGASALMLGITLVGNLPLNARTAAYPRSGDLAGWQDIRRRWERLHGARVLLDVAAFAALTAAALRDGQPRDPAPSRGVSRRRRPAPPR